MRLLSAGALALAIVAVHGFRDTSPFFMFSTSESTNLFDAVNTADPDSQLRTASSLTSDIFSILSQCPTDIYIIVSQPGVHPADYASSKTTPALSQKMRNGKKHGIRSSSTVKEVVGNIDLESWHSVLEESCGAQIVDVDTTAGIPTEQKTIPVVYNIWLPAPRTLQDLTENDILFASVLNAVTTQTYTVLYVTSPGKMSRRMQVAGTGVYEMESQAPEAMHIDLRRDLSSGMLKSKNNETLVDGPLFDRYQFLTPGLFMGFLVGFILLSIAYVGISALASLQVSYAAFDKESGQLASKKTQ